MSELASAGDRLHRRLNLLDRILGAGHDRGSVGPALAPRPPPSSSVDSRSGRDRAVERHQREWGTLG